MTASDLPAEKLDALSSVRERSPVPTPRGDWIMGQRWEDLLFCNWPVPADRLRSMVPDGLEVDTFDESGWVSMVPMWMERAHFRDLPPLPFLNSFPEVNVRTYVSRGDRAGVWFLSLDTESRINVFIARHAFHLPYVFADVAMERGEEIRFRSARPRDAGELDVSYRPAGAPAEPRPGTLEHFLTERYAMFCASHEGVIYRGDIQHDPWVVQPVAMDLRRHDVIAADGVDVSGVQPVAFYAKATDVVLWKPVTA